LAVYPRPGSEFFRKPEQALLPLYDRLEAMVIEPLGEESNCFESELTKQVIVGRKAIRDEWELEPEVLDKILNRTRPSAVGFQGDELAEFSLAYQAPTLFAS
jgi:hypothetical protein